MDDSNRRVLTKKRAILKASVTRIQHFVDYEVNSADNGLIHVKLNRLLSANEEFRQIQSEIELHDDENEEANAAYRVEFEDTVDVLEAKLRKASNVQTTHGSDEVLTQSSHGMSKNIKLPKINLPTFSGILTTWLHFKDTFEGLVVNNNDLSNIEKFHYLLSSLNGEAKDSIRNISISDTNFQVAYNILVNRYHSPKLIAAEYIRQIMETSNKLGSTESEIRHLIDTFKGSIDALNALNAQPSILDLLLNELLLSRLDKKLRLEFEKEHANLDAVGFKELINFLERRCQTLQLCSSTLATSLNNHPKPRSRMTPQQQSYISTAERCYICSEEHRLYKCPDFLKLSPDEKYKLIKDSKHCTNCLSPSHTWKACNSNTACKLCKKYHHTLLHQEDQKRATSNPRQARDTMAQSPQNNNTHQSSYHSLRSTPNTQVLLSTVTVKIKDLNGRYHHLRAVLDSGSQSNFISEQAVQQLKFKKKRTTAISLQAFGELTSQADSSVNIEVHSTISDFHFNMECIVLPRITGNIPASYIDYKEWNIPKDVILADPDFHLPQSTHLLIGAQFFLHLMKEGKRTRKGYPTLQDTHLGWILSGVYPQQLNNGQGPKSLFIRSDLSLEKQLQRFWALEEVSHVTHSPEHMECEKHFSDTTVRDESGRFMVELPMKKEGNLGNSKEIARQRFHFLERKLRLQSDLRRDYVEFMREYEALGHMVELQPNSTWRQPEYYIPHHAVHKHSSSTTKTRVVFDASARTDNGVALNDILMVGPTVQDDLCSLVMRFRMHKIAFTADVEKMYRQVRVHPKHQPLQCILWRESPQDELKSYALTTVTYGTSAAAYLATRCLVQLATDEGTRFPRAASVLRHDFYVDDCISGADTLDEALRLRVELQDLLQLGGFPLRKWCTNSPKLLESIPENLREHKHSLTDSESSIVKTLGLTWHPSTDQFQINCGLNSQHSKSKEPSCSKRMVLSIISSIFDPLGLITPVVVLFKVFMQRLWQEGSGWDDQLFGNLLDTWNDLYQQLPLLNHFKIPRLVLIEGIVKSIEIHCFCDASQTAYGASVYIRSVNNKGEVLTKLLCAKSRVAPLKQISIPRLELCGAITLVRLIKKTLGTLRAIPDSVQLWTDSTIVLAWLRACPTKWKTFVANRVAEIQDVAPASHWRHVKSQDNPADIASRGVQPLLLQDCALWWEGPSWLRLDPSSWPSQVRCDTSKIPDQRIVTSLIVMQHDDAFLDHFSSLNRLLRTVSHCLRFSSNCKKSRSERDTSPLKPQEINNAFNVCLNIVQSVSYQREIQCLKLGKAVDATNKLKSLSPIMDQDGYLRVGGRLQNAPVSYEAKHQLILPPEHHFTKLVILSEHVRLLHAGPQLLISSLRQRYWVPRIRQVVKKCTHSCYTCFRLRTATSQQKMANLPRFRVTPSRAFMNVGVDYAGPFLIRMGTQRSKTTGKAYVGIFTCLATRAVHMEVISDLTTSAFMAALRRFTSRRGCPSNIYSDNGTNFIGASRELKELQEFLRDEKEERDIVEVAGGIGITWHFIPPSVPHFGGVWESMVKAFKHHLRRTMGTTILTFEELTTLSSQIEACLNSRPLSRLSDDPTDSSFLTPAHFLIGEPLTTLPDQNLKPCPLNSLSRWKHIQRMTQDFWQTWRKDYLNTLQQRHKWTQEHPNLRPGDLVLMKDDNLPPLQWRRGLIEAVHLGDDGLARVATVKTSSGAIMRPIRKLCVLPETNFE